MIVTFQIRSARQRQQYFNKEVYQCSEILLGNVPIIAIFKLGYDYSL